MIGRILAPWADGAVSMEHAGAGCPVTQSALWHSLWHTGCQTIQLEAQQGEASPCWSQAAVCFPLKLFSIIHLLSSSPSNPVFTRVYSHLPVTGNPPSTDSSRSSTRRVLRLARSTEALLCLLLQQEKFTQAINQEVQFLNVGVLQHSSKHQKKFGHLYSCRWKGYRSKSKIYIAHSAITLGSPFVISLVLLENVGKYTSKGH